MREGQIASNNNLQYASGESIIVHRLRCCCKESVKPGVQIEILSAFVRCTFIEVSFQSACRLVVAGTWMTSVPLAVFTKDMGGAGLGIDRFLNLFPIRRGLSFCFASKTKALFLILPC